MTTCLYAKEGVILLHGLCRSSASMEKMSIALSEAGFQVTNLGYASRTANIENLSDDAVGNALKSKELEHCSKIHFVTHSLGGILVRSYFSRHHSAKLGRVVMLGPPNQGSEVVDNLRSWWVFKKLNGPAGQELGTDENSIPNKLGSVNFELGVIAGDRSINLINSTMMKGPDDGKVSVEKTKVAGMKEHLTLHTTHPFIMKNKRAIRHTIAFLKHGTFKMQE